MSTDFLSFLERRKKDQEASKAEALQEVKRLNSLLRDNFNFETLYLTGSLTTHSFRCTSDLDLVIKGLPVNTFFKAYALLLKESYYQVDLKPFEDLTPDFQNIIIKGGTRIG